MYSNELAQAGQRHVPGFIGVFAADELPSIMCNRSFIPPFSFIVNTQAGNLPGEHWIAVSCEPKRVALVFDPLGNYYPPFLIHYLAKRFTKIYFNKIQYQNPSSRVCGQLCLQFLKSLRNLKLPEKISLMM